MCHQTICLTCNKTTWDGCGQHISQVLDGIPAENICTCNYSLRKPAKVQISPAITSLPEQSFFTQLSQLKKPSNTECSNDETHKAWLLRCVGRSCIGFNQLIPGPYKPLRLFYADYTASGRSLEFIEKYINEEVMPMYANTHTEASGTGRQTTHFREEARSIVAKHIGCNASDSVIFCGSGCTAAVNKMVHILNLRLPKVLDAKYGFKDLIPKNERPVVFIGPYEHHSNELPWRESIADVIVIAESSDGEIDLGDLGRRLEEFMDRPLLIGSFSAASNVTGILTNVERITVLLHSFGALAFWDFAAAAPYIAINVNGDDSTSDDIISSWPTKNRELWENRPYPASTDPLAIDAVFISPHKFLGGPNTVGVLACKSLLLDSGAPDSPGGGTVLFVNPGSHDYLSNPEAREEAGTPDIIGSIRSGLVFQLKDAIGVSTIMKTEEKWLEKAFKAWNNEPLIRILGSVNAPRLGIVSFMIRESPDVTEKLGANAEESGIGRYLHHNFVVALLNDVFGIQGRGGCSCAGPYGHRILDVSPEISLAWRELRRTGVNGITPGWARLNFHYVFSEAEVDFLIQSVVWIARYGWMLAPDYIYDPISGLWTHRFGHPELESSLLDISYSSGVAEYPCRHAWGTSGEFDTSLTEANDLLKARMEDMKAREYSPEFGAAIEKWVDVVDISVVKSVTNQVGVNSIGQGWLRLNEEQRKTSVFVCSDGSCGMWSRGERESDVLGTAPLAGVAQCSVAGGDEYKPLVTNEFVKVYEQVRWFALPDEILAIHLQH